MKSAMLFLAVFTITFTAFTLFYSPTQNMYGGFYSTGSMYSDDSTGSMYSDDSSDTQIYHNDTQHVVIGEMTRLEVVGDRVAWSCVPDISKDEQAFGENRQKFVCSFRSPGLYTVIAAVYKDDDVTVQKFAIQVGDSETIDPLPKPTIVEDTELVKTTVQWCLSTKADKPQCGLVAGVFAKVASEIESGKLTSASSIILKTAELNSGLELQGITELMSKIQEYITKESDSGRLVDTYDFTIVWRSLSKGLKQYESGM